MSKELQDILASIKPLATRGKISNNRAFAAWFAINFYDIDEDDALEAAAIDGGNDQGIDIVFPDNSSEEIIVLQAHYPENRTKNTPKNKWDAVVASLPFIKNPQKLAMSGRQDLTETLEMLRTKYPGYTYAVGLITLGLKSEEIERSRQAHEGDSAYSNFSFLHFAQEDILLKYKALVDAEKGILEDDLNFCGGYFKDSGDYGEAWVGSVAATDLKRLHAKYQDTLFAGNVRLFLGRRKGGINEQIIKTAQTSPGNFWALNNGITIVADSVIPIDKKNTSLKLRRFSIVNGCQTTSSLVQADAPSSAKVLVRVIAAKAGLKNEIVRYNNSQNAVKIWTVRAADSVQEQLRKDFQKISINYAPKQSGARKKHDARTIELDKVAQYLASSEMQYLLLAVDSKGELFDEPYQKIFKKGIKASTVYLAWLVGQLADEERQTLADELGKDDSNVGLLGVASAYWIIYCTYKILKKFSDLDSLHIVLEKMDFVEFKNALKKYIKEAIDIFYDAAVDTYDREQYGSFRSVLRSSKFLQIIDSKINKRIVRIPSKKLPDLAVVAKSAKMK